MDISQFHQTFFDESVEGLDVMESELLKLKLASPNDESINQIFRAIHSIKGGSGTFGFECIVSFTHTLETYLDAVRDHKMAITEETKKWLLEANDELRAIFDQFRAGNHQPDLSSASKIEIRFSQLMNQSNHLEANHSEAEASDTSQVKTECTYHISFIPNFNIVASGNDPLRIIRELQSLGELEVTTLLDHMPSWQEYNYEHCFLHWKIVLKTDSERDEILEIFEWVVDEAEIEIQLGDEGGSDSSDSIEDSGPQGVEVQQASIRIDVAKLDELFNLIGELVINQSMITELSDNLSDDHAELKNAIKDFAAYTLNLQDCAMTLRMVPIGFSFNRLPRLINDISERLGKKIDYEIEGESTEIDKTIIEKIIDPIVHLVRNALDHGVETPEERLANNKPERGKLLIKAYQESGYIKVVIKDDGRGINVDRVREKAIEKGMMRADQKLSDSEITDFIFTAGFSTKAEANDISGRGVGMDVVRQNIQSLGGSVYAESELGQGTAFTISLPLTLAIIEGQMVKFNGQTFIIPINLLVESISYDALSSSVLIDGLEVCNYRSQYIPLLYFDTLFDIERNETSLHKMVCIVKSEDKLIGFVVDDLLMQIQAVIKSYENNYKYVVGLLGATILGDGSVAFILDVKGLVDLASQRYGLSNLSDRVA